MPWKDGHKFYKNEKNVGQYIMVTGDPDEMYEYSCLLKVGQRYLITDYIPPVNGEGERYEAGGWLIKPEHCQILNHQVR